MVSDRTWWLHYGLDGLVAGLIGGLVTAFAVIMTIRHERRRVRRDEMLRAVRELNTEAMRLSVTLDQVETVADEINWLMSLHAPLATAHAFAVMDFPSLGRELEQAQKSLFSLLGRTWDRDKANQLARALSMCAWAWLARPGRFGKIANAPDRPWRRWDELISTSARTEQTVMRPWTDPGQHAALEHPPRTALGPFHVRLANLVEWFLGRREWGSVD